MTVTVQHLSRACEEHRPARFLSRFQRDNVFDRLEKPEWDACAVLIAERRRGVAGVFTTVGGKAKGMGTSSSKATEVTDGTEAEKGGSKDYDVGGEVRDDAVEKMTADPTDSKGQGRAKAEMVEVTESAQPAQGSRRHSQGDQGAVVKTPATPHGETRTSGRLVYHESTQRVRLSICCKNKTIHSIPLMFLQPYTILYYTTNSGYSSTS